MREFYDVWHWLHYFFFDGFWVKAEPAADFADLLADLDRNVFEAADAALLPVTFFGAFVCDSVEAAADLAALLAVLLLSVFDAAVAAFLPVTSLFAMIDLFVLGFHKCQ